jgi:hypothetical protein
MLNSVTPSPPPPFTKVRPTKWQSFAGGSSLQKPAKNKGRGREKANKYSDDDLKASQEGKAFSAVILAGEKPARMMPDKAFVKIGGRTLLARQIELVRAAGAAEVFISGRDGVDYSIFGCPVLKNRLYA